MGKDLRWLVAGPPALRLLHARRASSALSNPKSRMKREAMNHPTPAAPAILNRQSGRPRPAWRTVNITPAERVGRLIVGLAAIVTGIVLLTAAGSALAVALEVLLIAAGLDLAVTGALGHCPLYAKLGYLPKSLRRAR